MARLLHLTSAAWLVAMAVVPDAGAAEGSGEAPLEVADEAAIAELFAQPAPDTAASSGASGVKFDTAWILDIAAAAFTESEPRQLGGHDPAANGFTCDDAAQHVARCGPGFPVAFGQVVDVFQKHRAMAEQFGAGARLVIARPFQPGVAHVKC